MGRHHSPRSVSVDGQQYLELPLEDVPGRNATMQVEPAQHLPGSKTSGFRIQLPRLSGSRLPMVPAGRRVGFQRPKGKIGIWPVSAEELKAHPISADFPDLDRTSRKRRRMQSSRQSVTCRALPHAKRKDRSIRDEQDKRTLLKGRTEGEPLATLVRRTDEHFSDVRMT